MGSPSEEGMFSGARRSPVSLLLLAAYTTWLLTTTNTPASRTTVPAERSVPRSGRHIQRRPCPAAPRRSHTTAAARPAASGIAIHAALAPSWETSLAEGDDVVAEGWPRSQYSLAGPTIRSHGSVRAA